MFSVSSRGQTSSRNRPGASSSAARAPSSIGLACDRARPPPASGERSWPASHPSLALQQQREPAALLALRAPAHPGVARTRRGRPRRPGGRNPDAMRAPPRREPARDRGVDHGRHVRGEHARGRRRESSRSAAWASTATPLRWALARAAATLAASWSTASTGAKPSRAAAIASAPAPQPRSAKAPAGSSRRAVPGTSASSGARRSRTRRCAR